MIKSWFVVSLLISSTAVTPVVAEEAVVSKKTIGDFLSSFPKPTTKDYNVKYSVVNESALKEAVGWISQENFTSASASLKDYISSESSSNKGLGYYYLALCYGMEALEYPDKGKVLSLEFLNAIADAKKIDNEVTTAPEVIKLTADLEGLGYLSDNPEGLLNELENSANKSRDSYELYHAGILSRRLAKRAWAHMDTSEMDKRTLALLSKAVARNPANYEFWGAYLPALFPVGMHDIASIEAEKMYKYFSKLRTPLLGDRGPALLYINYSSNQSVEKNMSIHGDVRRQWPDSPMPDFEIAMLTIETTASLAPARFEEFVYNVKKGKLILEPFEAGLYPSALYKLGFLYDQQGELDKALHAYTEVEKISPNYAEIHYNKAIVYYKKAQNVHTTEIEKKEFFELAKRFLNKQKDYNYRGKTLEKVKALEIKIEPALQALM